MVIIVEFGVVPHSFMKVFVSWNGSINSFKELEILISGGSELKKYYVRCEHLSLLFCVNFKLKAEQAFERILTPALNYVLLIKGY